MAKSTTTTETNPAAQALIGAGLEAALETRRKAWFGSLDEALSGLVGKVDGFDPERMGEDEAFVSALASATRLATETHGAVRLEALRNTVLNAAVGITVDDITHTGFMRLLERMSDLHLRILRVVASPLTAPEVTARGVELIGRNMEWVVRGAFLDTTPLYAIQAALKDLVEAGLVVDMTRLGRFILTKDGPAGVCIAPVGDRFLRFIGPPAAVH